MSDSDSSLSDKSRVQRDEYLQVMRNLPNPPPPRQEMYCFECRRAGKRGKVAGFDGLLQHCSSSAIGSSRGHKSLLRKLNALASPRSYSGANPKKPSKSGRGAWIASAKQGFTYPRDVPTNAMKPSTSLPLRVSKENTPNSQNVGPGRFQIEASSTLSVPKRSIKVEPVEKNACTTDASLGLPQELKHAQEYEVVE